MDAQERWDKGGLDFPDIRTSWKAFKMSWFRRLMNAKGTWVEIFKQMMKPKFVFNNPQKALLNLDMIYLSKKIKFIKSDFWRPSKADDMLPNKEKSSHPIHQYMGKLSNKIS